MKKLLCLVLCCGIFLIPLVSFAAVGPSAIEKVVPGPWGQTGKAAAIGIRTATSLRYITSVVSYAGIALMVASLATEYVPKMQQQWIDYVFPNQNLEIVNGQIVKKTGTATYFPDGSQYEVSIDTNDYSQTCNGACYPAGTLHEMGIYPNAASAQAAHNDGRENLGTNFLMKTYSNGDKLYAAISFTRPGSGWNYYLYFWAVTGAGVPIPTHTHDQYSPATTQDIATELQQDLADSGRPAHEQARDLEEAMETDLADGVNGDPSQASEDAKEDYQEALYNGLPQSTKDDLNDDPEPESGDDANTNPDVVNKNLGDIIVNAIRRALGLDYVPNSVKNEEIDPNENTTVLGQNPAELGNAETLKTAQETIFTDLMDEFWDTISAFRTNVMGAITGALNVGGGSCSLGSAAVFGTSINFTLCDLDLTTFRTCILAIASIAAVLMLIL